MSVEFNLSAESVRFLIEKIRMANSIVSDSYEDGHEGDVEFDEENLTDSHHHEGLAEEENDDMTEEELRELLQDMNVDETAELYALLWIGRGDFEADDLEQVMQDAQERAQSTTKTASCEYFLGQPLLADHLEAGLDTLGL
ncbi:DUF3775 domain-containing protein [Roseibium aestuarii]|uniref:DUF3775 domain-containing protein n=1 Tax=Roseibium aestuarii TaxID=2600299 RepID=A0ABW4JXV9_9HYPH|nr:DUF3775 domain-containing protein [Roseibium aestuarii]